VSLIVLFGLVLLIAKIIAAVDGPKLRLDDSPSLQPLAEPRPIVPSDWRAIAFELHLGIEEKRGSHTLYGQLDGFEVTIEARGSNAEIRVRAGPTFDSALRIVRRGASDARTSVLVGDEALDRAAIIDGNRAWVLAKLDLSTRELVRRLIESGQAHVSRGHVRAEMDAELTGRDRLVDTVRNMLELARGLSRGGTIIAGLCENTAGDLDPRVRLENLRALVAEYPEHLETTSMAERALDDEDLEVRRCAAEFLRVQAPRAGGLSLVKDESSRGALSFDRATGGLAALPAAKEEDDSR
jgi:hypothetical protein